MTEETTETGETKDGLAGFRERKLDVGVALQELGELADGLGAKSLRERVQRDLVRKLEEDRFHLVVVGEFNHGKSSFVNALLEKEALPVGAAWDVPTVLQRHRGCAWPQAATGAGQKTRASPAGQTSALRSHC